ncbi:glycosyltransferase [Trinickia violacea]|uniref:Glycosyltransferase n=1 Tax=Trinickia violacea TaxID=2571746 RepID=A0A4P8J071_9BURK|nr:glycosyltransferase [Trinickia violacea]QCP54117.1 glycosyltransferase [Trinickia violacea]
MNICLCSNRFPPSVVGGAELTVSYLAGGLKERGHKVSVLSLSDTHSRVVYDWKGVDVLALPNFNIYNQFYRGARSWIRKTVFSIVDIFNPFVFIAAILYFRGRKFDVLCTHNIKGIGPAIWLAAKLHGIPIVHVIHDYWMICPSSTMFKNGRACSGVCRSCAVASFPKGKLSRFVTSVVGVSNFALNRHIENNCFMGSKASVIHNSRPPMRNAGNVSKRDGTFIVGFIGRIEAEKGVRECFEAVKASGLSDVEIYVAGRDPDGVLKKLTEEFGGFRIKYFGFIEPEDFYSLVDVVVVTSMWDEPFGNVAFEPWEFSKPTVAFASGGLPEVFGDLKELVVGRGDVASLGAIIHRLAVDSSFYDHVSARCVERRAYFSPDRQVGEFERMLLEI